MNKLNRKELLKLADLSALQLAEDEIDPLLNDLRQILEYAAQLDGIKLGTRHKPSRNTNQLRDDVAHKHHSEALLSQAPEREQTCFVVPQIIDHDKEEQA